MNTKLLLAGVGLVGWLAVPQNCCSQPGVSLVSAGLPGRPSPSGGGGASSGAALSADGRYVVFVSAAKNLLDQPLRGNSLDVFVRDRATGGIRLASAGLDGASGGDGDSWMPVISADGRWVVFQSQARNLVTNVTQGAGDIYARDMVAGTTALVSVSQTGGGGSGISLHPVISPDGRYILFESVATNLVEMPTTGLGDVYLRDLISGVTTLASVDKASALSRTGASWDASLSADGRLAVFLTAGTVQPSVPPISVKSAATIVLRHLTQEATYVPVVALSGLPPATGAAARPLLSADGRFLVFRSSSTNLTPDNLGGATSALYWQDLNAGTNVLIRPAAANYTGDLEQVVLTPDGQFVAYTHTNQVYLWNAQSGASSLVSVDSAGAPAAGVSGSAAVSDDGQVVAFISNATNLTDAAVLGNFQVYVRDMRTGATRLASANPAGAGSRSDCLYPALSANGQAVAFDASDGDLVEGDFNHASDVLLWDRGKGAGELISARASAQPLLDTDYGGWLAPGGLSADGRYVLFTSISGQFIANDNNGVSDVFIYDSTTGETKLVSVNRDGAAAGEDASMAASMTLDARYVVFLSRARDLVAAGVDTNRAEDVYVRDMASGQTVLVSVNLSGSAAGVVATTPPLITADGRYAAFVSKAANLVAGATYTTEQVFLRDLTGGVTTRVATNGKLYALCLGPGSRALCLWFGSNKLSLYDSIASSNVVVSASGSGTPVFTPSGQFLAFWQTVSDTGLILYDTAAKSASKLLPVIGNDCRYELAVSDDGSRVAFVYNRDGLVPGDVNGTDDVFVVDRRAPGSPMLVSVNFLGTASGNGPSDCPRLSADGRLVLFRSAASDLVPGDSNGQPDLFVRDLQTGVTRRLSVGQSGSGGGSVFTPALSADGSTVAFTSAADDFVTGDFNGQLDVFTVGVPALAVVDSDHDGLPDDWETYYFGGLGPDGTADADGDGQSNLAEYIAGTNPGDAVSVLRLTAEWSASAQAVTLSWPAAALRKYTVRYRDSLADAVWQELPSAPVAADAGRLKVQDAAPGQQRYYQVLVTK